MTWQWRLRYSYRWLKSWVRPCKLIWHDTDPDTAQQLSRRVQIDLMGMVEDLREPSDLVFHIVSLTDHWSGPSVCVWGQQGSDAFHCAHSETTQWDHEIRDCQLKEHSSHA